MAAVIFGMVPYLDETEVPDIDPAITVTYGALHRAAWACAVSWVIFACIRGYGGHCRISSNQASIYLTVSLFNRNLCKSLLVMERLHAFGSVNVLRLPNPHRLPERVLLTQPQAPLLHFYRCLNDLFRHCGISFRVGLCRRRYSRGQLLKLGEAHLFFR